MIKMIKKIFIFCLICLFFINVVYAQSSAQSSVSSLYEKTPAWLQKFLGFGTIQSFGDAFLRGFFAGLLIYGVYRIVKLFRWLHGKNPLKQDEEEYEESQTKWFNMIVGSFWKVPLIGIFFAVVMQIPLLNRLLYFILFDFFFINFIPRVLTLSFLVGFFPALVENFFKETYRFKLKKKVLDARKVGAITTAQAKIISDGI